MTPILGEEREQALSAAQLMTLELKCRLIALGHLDEWAGTADLLAERLGRDRVAAINERRAVA